MRKKLLRLASFLTILALLPLHASAQPQDEPEPACRAIVKSPQDAVEKADWIVEGDIDNIVTSTDGAKISLVLTKTESIKGPWPTHKGMAGIVAIGPCFPKGNAAFIGDAGGRLMGKRMRIFGSKHMDDPTWRTFYIQPSDQEMPSALHPASFAYSTKVHRQGAVQPLGGGWRRAHSTEGEYSIDMPCPFEDISGVNQGDVGLLLRAHNEDGLVFFATREPNSPDASLAGIFDTDIRNKNTTVVQFKGVPAISARTIHGALIHYLLVFRVPGGTYMLGILTPKDREKDAIAVRDRFYNSLAFD